MLSPKKLEFHAIVERKAQELEYGSANFTLTMKDGEPVIKTLQIVKVKRYKNTDKP
ncbi:MAG: hypothetical protein WC286_04695 [Bacilli bacterium]|jgi:hypothetical protein